MVVKNIPSVFWYSASLCMLAVTATLCFTMLRSSDVDIQIANIRYQSAHKERLAEMEKAVEDQERLVREIDALRRKASEGEAAQAEVERLREELEQHRNRVGKWRHDLTEQRRAPPPQLPLE